MIRTASIFKSGTSRQQLAEMFQEHKRCDSFANHFHIDTVIDPGSRGHPHRPRRLSGINIAFQHKCTTPDIVGFDGWHNRSLHKVDQFKKMGEAVNHLLNNPNGQTAIKLNGWTIMVPVNLDNRTYRQVSSFFDRNRCIHFKGHHTRSVILTTLPYSSAGGVRKEIPFQIHLQGADMVGHYLKGTLHAVQHKYS